MRTLLIALVLFGLIWSIMNFWNWIFQPPQPPQKAPVASAEQVFHVPFPGKPEIDKVLDNIGDDVKTRNWTAAVFPGTEGGITRWGRNGICLNIYNSFYLNHRQHLDYMLNRLKNIAITYGYSEYCIMLSKNEKQLMCDKHIEHYTVE